MEDPGALWNSAAALAVSARRPTDLRAHGLHLLAAARFRALGRPVPTEFIAEERHAAMTALAVPVLLERVRAAYDGAVMVMKGPEVALRYPDPGLRPFNDIDMLAEDANAAQRALIAAGFREVGPADGWERCHHLRPVVWPGLPIAIEVHRAPHWVAGLEPPPLEELFDAGRPSGLGVAGILAPASHHHALLIATHAWAHEPLWRLVDLLDVAALTHGMDPDDVRSQARRWRCERVWRTTERAVDATLYGGSRPLALRTWARHLHPARERTVFESRMQRLAGPAWGLPPRTVPRALLGACTGHLRRHNAEPWRAKLVRSGALVRNMALPRSEHDRRLDPAPAGAEQAVSDAT